MTTQLTDLRRLVRERVGVPTSDDFFTDPVLTDTINQALLTLDAEARWPWMETVTMQPVTAAQGYFLAPADWRATRALFNGYDQMQLMSPTDLMGVQGGAGNPEAWSVRGNQIVVAPPPSSDVTLAHYYYRQTTRLVLDADTTMVPDQFIEAIVCKAAELLSAREDDTAARQLHLADYKAWVARMSRDMRRATGPLKVRVRPGGWI